MIFDVLVNILVAVIIIGMLVICIMCAKIAHEHELKVQFYLLVIAAVYLTAMLVTILFEGGIHV